MSGWRTATGGPEVGVPVWLGLGSNEGDRRTNLADALQRVRALGVIEAVSPVYETEPVGRTDQPDFWNLVTRLATAIPAPDLLAAAKRIETDLGRRDTGRWGPRPIDIDILLYNGHIIREPGLEIPHPRMHVRGFVVRPFADIDPDILHPVTGKRIDEILADGQFEATLRLFSGIDLLQDAL